MDIPDGVDLTNNSVPDSDGYTPIAKNMQVFLDSYIPDKLPYREKELGAILQILQPILYGNPVSNIFVIGKTGTGKTIVVKKIGHKIESMSKEGMQNVVFQYINCSEVDNIYGFFCVVGNKLAEGTEFHIPYTGWPLDKVIDTFRSILNKRKIKVILVMDEIDKLIHKVGDSYLYTLINLSNENENFRINIVGITNDVNLPSQITDERVKSRLNDEKITFAPYNAEQLATILDERAKLAFDESVLDNGVISLCAAIGAHEHGDARRAINLLRMAAQLAERKRSKKITTEDVYDAKRTIDIDYTEQILSDLPLHQKIILYAIVKSMENSTKRIQTAPEIITMYTGICMKMEVSPLSPRRINDLINDLSTLGILKSTVQYHGRKGRIKIVELWVPIPNITKMIKSDSTLNVFMEEHPELHFKQKTLF